MKSYPPIPDVADAPDELFERGHVWLLEQIDGAQLRFQLRDSDLLRFGDRGRVYEDPDAVPEPYQHAVRHVRERLDRQALRQAVDDVEAYVFFGQATQHHVLEYDWDRTPSFLGFDVWSADAGRFRPPDAAEQIFERLGLQPVNAFERERRARDFDPSSYAIPRSAWYDGPAAGVVVRDKKGRRARIPNPAVEAAGEPGPVGATADAFARQCATTERFEKLATRLDESNRPVTFETLFERVFEDVVREEHRRLYHRESSLDVDAFRTELARLTRQFVDEYNDTRW
jgi:hypothetical protein